MDFINYIKTLSVARGHAFAYGNRMQINEKLNKINFSASAGGIVNFCYLIEDEGGGGIASAQLAIYFCKIEKFDFDTDKISAENELLKDEANKILEDIKDGNTARYEESVRFSFGYDDFSENVLWCCMRVSLYSLSCNCKL